MQKNTTNTTREYRVHADGQCSWAACAEEGKFPAPKSPVRPKERYFFCLAHIREYNKSWNYFNEMDPGQIDNFQKSSITGHRPTWKFGVGTASYNNMEEIRQQVFGKYRDTYSAHYKNAQEYDAFRRLPKQTQDALKVLGLQYPLTLQDLKKRYKNLAKAHHPDLNGKMSDEKIKTINHAYNLLKCMDIFE